MADYQVKAKATDIPWEYQTQFGDAASLEEVAKRMMAQRAIIQKGMQPQMVSGHYIKASPMQHLADLLAAGLSGKASSDAIKSRQAVMQRMDAAEKGQLSQIAELMAGRPEMQEPTPEGGFGPGDARQLPEVPANPLAAARYASGSQFPRVQDFGKGISETVRNQTSAFASQLTPEGLRYMAQYGTVPPRNSGMWKPDASYGPVGPIPGTENRPDPNNPGKILPPVLGQQNQADKKWAEVGGHPSVNTRVDIGTNEGVKAEFAQMQKDADVLYGKEGSKQALTNAKNLQNLGSAMSLVATTPPNMGVDSDWLTFAQSLSKMTGKPVPDKVPRTQLYNAYIIPQVANIIKGFGAGTGLSDADREFAAKAVAMATNDPRMIRVALAYMLRAEMTEAKYYNDRAAALGNWAESKGLDRRNWERPVNFNVDFTAFQKAFGMPNDIMKPNALEAWTSEVLGSSPLDDAMRRYGGKP